MSNLEEKMEEKLGLLPLQLFVHYPISMSSYTLFLFGLIISKAKVYNSSYFGSLLLYE